MTDVDELVKRLRRLDYKTDLDEAAADTLERQAKWLEGFVKQSDEMAMALSSEATKSDHLFAENSKLRTRIAELEVLLKPFAFREPFQLNLENGENSVMAIAIFENEQASARAALNGEKG